LSHLYIKCIILPRQARDKHRENSKNGRFLQLPTAPPSKLHWSLTSLADGSCKRCRKPSCIRIFCFGKRRCASCYTTILPKTAFCQDRLGTGGIAKVVPKRHYMPSSSAGHAAGWCRQQARRLRRLQGRAGGAVATKRNLKGGAGGGGGLCAAGAIGGAA
jgi:hypothetical protein